MLTVSDRIAPEMTVIDDGNNGWRQVILPVAHRDPLVQLTVMAAAAIHHQSSNKSEALNATAIYAEAVSQLRKRQDLVSQSMEERQAVLLALLVLLAAAMIKGSADFRTILGLIDSAVTAIGGEDAVMSGELGTFIVRQVRK